MISYVALVEERVLCRTDELVVSILIVSRCGIMLADLPAECGPRAYSVWNLLIMERDCLILYVIAEALASSAKPEDC